MIRHPRPPRSTPPPRPIGLLVVLLVVAIITAGIGVALALTPTGSHDFAFIASSATAIYSPINPFWLTWSHPIGLALLALGAGTTGATLAASTRPRR